MKKTSFLSLLTLLLMMTGAVLYAQTEDSHAKLTEQHKKGKEHTDAIASGDSKSMADHKKHATEARKNLNQAKSHHAKLKTADKGKNSEAHAAIEKNHADAEKHLNSLDEELKKPNPDEKKVKEHAKNHSDAVNKANAEHEKLKKKG